jgi:transcriptional regulator with XRE-family HTH domain
MKKSFSLRNIASLRARDSLTQGQLGQMIGTTQQTIARWEIGTAQPNNEKLIAMADIFGCSLEMLIGREPVGQRRASIEQKLLEFKALDDGTAAAELVDPLTRQVFEEAKADPERFEKRVRAMHALIDLQKAGGPASMTEMIDAVLAA